MKDNANHAFREGQIVDAHFLHVDSIDLSRHCRRDLTRLDVNIYTVQRKQRPMLLLGPVGARTKGVQWYWALKFTTARGDPKWAAEHGYTRAGPLLDNQVSYVGRIPHSIRGNLLGAVRSELNPNDFRNILLIAGIISAAPLPRVR